MTYIMCVYIYIYIYIYICMYICVCMHECVYIHVYMYNLVLLLGFIKQCMPWHDDTIHILKLLMM